ncbi:cyclopropane-fatty-acyl-phospholipid synthase family protein [Uliginosibacterium sp. H1]|uniref:cyclopropane-fatty-acyl-phospholipid synthase family protein n=1 Tax=Uliginosibacterium sp. H1 TaxID=3114757 RepID=UPI002E19377E|nr:cyclopropane-fatty-acyl-phospholipid synthase family protein [Uliginosibacterium sp. H1]
MDSGTRALPHDGLTFDAESASRAPRVPRSLLGRSLTRLARELLDHVQAGRIELRLPDGQRLHGEGATHGPEAAIHLHRWRPLWRMLLRGDIGLAESYRDGDWSTPDLTALLEAGIRNDATWDNRLAAAWPLRLLLRLMHLRRDNTRRGSRRNIAFHYDLGNDFYRQWLDADLIYSSGIYRRTDDTLEQAQAEKLRRIVELLRLPAGDAPVDVLEIGCGWGALACSLAQTSGARVTGLTLSSEQLVHAQQRVEREGLAGRVDLRLQDYRAVDGQYDRIVSIEMIEAVGERHWPTYFRTMYERLKPGGIAVIQAITIDDERFEHYRQNVDFIQRFIFPGGMLPSPGALHRETTCAGLELEASETFGASYAATLVEWRRRFRTAWPQIAALGFDAAFARLWEYYLCYCEAGFRSRRVDVGLYVMRRPA